MTEKRIRIGGASGAWGDSATAVPQLVRHGNLDFLVFDYLAELTMSLLTAARMKNPEMGYATDFVGAVAAMLPEITKKKIRIVSNAGGVNPAACAAALRKAAAEQELSPRIAVITGDDVLSLLDDLKSEDLREMDTNAPLPDRLLSANAYLGALPIARALDAGADIVITGRCVDSAVTLGAMIHSFGWLDNDYDLLAAGSLAGHIIECGCQATGGLFTDWRDVSGWENMGYPIVEAAADGSFTVTKPEGTGGLVSVPAVAEQILYEIGDPATYILPDVVCDLTDIRLEQAGPDRVAVSGAKGRAPTSSYKISATYTDGFKAHATLTIIGFDAAAKARRTADAILKRAGAMLAEAGFAAFTRTNVEVIGAETSYGANAAAEAREVVLKISATHADRKALGIFSREIAPAGLSFAPGTTGLGGRPKVTPNVRLFSFLIDKTRITPKIVTEGTESLVSVPAGVSGEVATTGPESVTDEPHDGPTFEMPLIRIAHGRSGDKGDNANIGVIARRPEFGPVLRRELTAEKVAAFMRHYVEGPVHRYEVPGLGAFNFLCERALDGGVASSLRNDPWGKGFAQILLSMPVAVPAELMENARDN